MFSQKRKQLIMANCQKRFQIIVLLTFLLFNSIFSVSHRSRTGCVVCGKKKQGVIFQNSDFYKSDFPTCFGIEIEKDNEDDNEDHICETCRRAVQEHRRLGKTFYHVSIIWK